MTYKTTYQAIKEYSTTYSIAMKWLEEESSYFITLTDKEITFQTSLSKNIEGADLIDFETNVKPMAQAPSDQLDIDGAQIVRVKAAKKGWTFGAIPIEFITAEIDSLYSKLPDNTNRFGITLKFFNSSGQEITQEGLLQINEASIIRTVIDFEPTYDYEIIGGTLRIDQDINSLQACRLWIIAVPDIPVNMGGSKEMAGGINLRYLAPNNEFHVDGRVSKTLTYSPIYHTNKLRFIFEHTAGLKVPIQIVVELFRL